jgi:membrane protein DedA with SNARE-associated domain
VSFTGPLAYAAIYVAAMVEGEVVFVVAAVLVAAGKLNPLAVMTVGALGAASGDQMFFYAFRGRIAGWLTRSRAIAARHASIVARVRRHQSLMILGIRFLPGLRIAITAACAYSEVSPVRFSTLNLLSAFAWAVVLLTLVSHVGPGVLRYAGIKGIWGAIVPGALLILFVWWIGRELPAGQQPGGDSQSPTEKPMMK